MMRIVVVAMTGEHIHLDVEGRDSIAVVKAYIQAIFYGAPPHRIRLSFSCRLLEDCKTVADYNIYDGSVLQMRLLTLYGMETFVVNWITRTSFVLGAEANATIGSLKERIEERVGIPKERQILSYNCVEMKDERTLGQYRINPFYTPPPKLDLELQQCGCFPKRFPERPNRYMS